MALEQFYKLARPDGWDFYTGKTINYRKAAEGIGREKIVKVPNANLSKGLCSNGVIHASKNPNDCFIGAKIPCSAYLVEGKPLLRSEDKCGFLWLRVIQEITELDTLFGWKYTAAVNPVNPLTLPDQQPDETDLILLKRWASVWDSVGTSVRASVWDSVRDSVAAYIGSLFPQIEKWEGKYPFQPAVDLWNRGLVPSYDGAFWRLHTGKKAKIIWLGKI